MEYEVCGWGEGEECWGILKGVILGAPNRESTWKALDEILDRRYQFKDGSGLRVVRTLIGLWGALHWECLPLLRTEYHEAAVCTKRYGRARDTLGLQNREGKGLNAPLVMLGVDDGKQQIMNRLTIDKPGPMFFHFPEDEEGIMQNRGYDNLYFRGIVSEHRKRSNEMGCIVRLGAYPGNPQRAFGS